MKSTISCVDEPGVNTAATPSSFSSGMSSAGIVPPTVTTTSSAPCSSSSFTTRGTNTATSVHWGLKHTIFENTGDKNQLGGGAYLFDPQGDLRLAELYPCLVGCADPLDGAIKLSVQPRSQREWVDISNVSSTPADLYGYQLIKPGYQYIFDSNSVLQPGERLRLYGGGNPSNDSRLTRYWGINHPMYADSGGNILLRNFRDQTLACDAWGGGHC